MPDKAYDHDSINVHKDVPEHVAARASAAIGLIRGFDPEIGTCVAPALDKRTGRVVYVVCKIVQDPQDPDQWAAEPMFQLLSDADIAQLDSGTEGARPGAALPDLATLAALPDSDIEAVLGDLFGRILEQSEPRKKE